MSEVILWSGAGQIGMAIARRIGYGKKSLSVIKTTLTRSKLPR